MASCNIYVNFNILKGWEGLSAQAGIASLNHYSKGAMVEWLYKSMLGIKVKGENTFEISPVIGDGVNFAKGKYASIYGKIAVSWKLKDTHALLHVEIPVNTKAYINLKSDEYKEVGSGVYDFEVAL